jgi:hypothetical protein
MLLVAACLMTPALAQESAPRSHKDGWLSDGRFSVGVPLEATVVGFSAGLRPELLYRPFSADGGTHLRVALGVMPGLEFTFMPVNIGWRQIFRRGEFYQPVVGAGYEHQLFLIPDYETVQRGALYLEGGSDFRLDEHSHVGALIAVDAAVFTRPGFGLSGRINYRYDF